MEELNQVLKQRRQKAQELAELGVNLYANDFRPAHRISDILAKNDNPDAPLEEGVKSVAGRIMALRKFGKAAFLHIQDETGRIQVYVKRDGVGAETYQIFKKLDVGDIAGFGGTLFRTQTGELTIDAATRQAGDQIPAAPAGEVSRPHRCGNPLSPALCRSDHEPGGARYLRKRVEIIRLIRDFLTNRGFMEVETPMMQAIAGGATAKPFKTHHNALGMDLYLRIAPELYLKRLLVGGFEKVFEINRNFRNEGLSTRHNPEFTMLEFYQAFATYEDLMDLTEEMVSYIAAEVTGSMVVSYQGQEVDLSPPWKRYTMDEALMEVGKVDKAVLADPARTRQLALEKGIVLEPHGRARQGQDRTV